MSRQRGQLRDVRRGRTLGLRFAALGVWDHSARPKKRQRSRAGFLPIYCAKRFHRGKEIASYVGLVPEETSSGEQIFPRKILLARSLGACRIAPAPLLPAQRLPLTHRNPEGNIDDSTFGVIGSAGDPRIAQAAVKFMFFAALRVLCECAAS